MILKTVLLVGASVATLSCGWASNAEQNTPNNVAQERLKPTCPPRPKKGYTDCWNGKRWERIPVSPEVRARQFTAVELDDRQFTAVELDNEFMIILEGR